MPLTEEGTYFGKIVEMGTDQLDNADKTKFIYVTWEISHRAVEGQWVEMSHILRDSRWFVSEKAEPYTMDKLLRLGFDGDLDDSAVPLRFTAEPNPQTQGTELVCRHNYKGEQAYENWDLAGMGQKEREPWGEDRKRLFKARYETRMASTATPQGAPSAPPAAPVTSATAPGPSTPAAPQGAPARAPDDEVADIADDEIPF